MRRASPIEYHGLAAMADTWERTLSQALCRDEDRIRYFGQVMGYALTWLSNLKELYCAYGPGGDNGKSVIFETIGHVMGEYAGTIPVSLLVDDKYSKGQSGGISLEEMKLRGLRCAMTSEAKRDQTFSMAKVKRIVSGGDVITARGLYSDFVSWEPTHTLILHTNFMPRAEGNDLAFMNRLRIILFGARFIPGDAGEDPNDARHIYRAEPRAILDQRLRAEAPGILAWLVRNAREYLANLRIDAPESVKAQCKSYHREQDLVGKFLESCCEILQPEVKGDQMKTVAGAFKRWLVESQGWEEKDTLSMRWLSAQFKDRLDIVKVQENPVTIYNILVNADWLPLGDNP
jgi:putative DNA primase/helicase